MPGWAVRRVFILGRTPLVYESTSLYDHCRRLEKFFRLTFDSDIFVCSSLEYIIRHFFWTLHILLYHQHG